MRVRDAAFVAFAIFITVSAAYVSGLAALAVGLDDEWSALVFGVVFTAAALVLDRASPR